MLKLLCSSFTDPKLYKNQKKIGGGAYGTVFSYDTSLVKPKSVALKICNFPKNIYERSVLHDIFSEITCLEIFRLDK